MSNTPISRTSSNIIKYLGQLIEIARKERKMSCTELAERIGIGRTTIHKILNGNPGVRISNYIEACLILGIPVLGNENNTDTMTALLCKINEVFPEQIRGKTIEVDDDF